MTGITIGWHAVIHSGDMAAEADRQYVGILERVLREATELQKVGLLRDPMSEREIAFLEEELRAVRSARPS